MLPVILKLVMMFFFMFGMALEQHGWLIGIPFMLIGGTVLWVFSIGWSIIGVCTLLVLKQSPMKLRKIKNTYPQMFAYRTHMVNAVDIVTDITFVLVCGMFFHQLTAFVVLVGYGFFKHTSVWEIQKV